MKLLLIFQIAQEIVRTGLEKRKVKFKQLLTQRHHTLFYKSRKKIKSWQKVHIDLTKKRFDLLKEAQNFVSDQENDVFV